MAIGGCNRAGLLGSRPFAGLLVCFTVISTIAPAQTAHGQALDANTRKEVVNVFAEALANDYARAEMGQKMAQAIRDKLSAGAYDRISSGSELAFALGDGARSVSHDKHLRVNFSLPQAGQPAPAAMPAQNSQIPEVRILPGNIGYIEVNGEPPLSLSGDDIAAAFALLHNTDALIIDGRGNGGGDPQTVAFYISYLSEGAPHVVLTFHPRKGGETSTRTTDVGPLSYGAKKPVYYLTSHRTFSGGEELGYDIQAFKRGLVVGETTGGGGNLTTAVALGHGFVALVPIAYAVNPVTGTSWEGIGVKPDVDVTASQAPIEARRLAAERLKSGTTDPAVLAALDNLLALPEQSAASELSTKQIAGVYASPDGRTAAFFEKDGSLFLQVPPGAPAIRLVPLGADRYHCDAFPDDFIDSFVKKGATISVTVETGDWPPLIAIRQN